MTVLRFVKFSAALSLCMFLVVPSTAFANLLTNPSFESGTVGSAPDDWGAFNFGTFSTKEASMPVTGNHSLKMGSAGLGSGSTGVFQAVLNIVPNTSYTFNILAKYDENSGFGPGASFGTDDLPLGVNIQLEWFPDPLGSSTGGMISEDVLTGMADPANGATYLTSSYQPYSITATAPATAGHVRAVFRARHVTHDVYWEDAEVLGLQVPEPASLGLALFAGLGLLSTRRRSQR